MPVFEITTPEGKTLEITAPEGATKEQALAYAQSQYKPSGSRVDQIPGMKPTSEPKPYSFNPVGILEAAGTAATGMIGGLAGQVAGVGKTLTSGKLGTQEGVRAGEDVARRVSSALTYQPRTEGGRELVEEVGKLTSKLAGVPPSQALSASVLAGPAMQQAKGVLDTRRATAAAAMTKEQALNSVKDDTLAAARAEGYKVPKSAINPSFVSNRLESIGGKAAVGQKAALDNQAITNKIARREAGLAADQPITEGTLEAVRKELAQPYRAVAEVSSRANTALEKLKEARAESKVFWNHHNRSADPVSLRKAEALDVQAEMLEKVIASEARKAGKPELAAELAKARTALAKNYTVERALNLGSGDVDAMVIGRILDKGAKLTGGLETVGKFANAFSPYAREAGKIPTPGVSKSEALASVLLGTGGVASGLGPLPAVLPLLSHPARSLALANQSPRTYGGGLGSRMYFPTSPELELSASVGLNATPLLNRNNNQ